MTTGTGAELEVVQRQFLMTVYGDLFDTGKWPRFDVVDRQFYREHGVDSVQVLRSIPPSLIRGGYDKAWRGQPQPNAPIELTLEGIAACQNGYGLVQHFLGALRFLAKREREFEPNFDKPDDELVISGRELWNKSGIAWSAIPALRLRRVLEAEAVGVSVIGTDEDWNVSVGREIRHFKDVKTIEEYRQVMEGRRSADNRQPADFKFGSMFASAQSNDATQTVLSYVDPSVFRPLEHAVQKSGFDGTKLLALIVELNENYRQRHIYACWALLRAILDHVPPILGCRTFEQVANNYGWTRTDKKYMLQLVQARVEADDALHRPISGTVDVLRVEDFPSSARLNRLLQECTSMIES
jgi:hypothetical protein